MDGVGIIETIEGSNERLTGEDVVTARIHKSVDEKI
jgi:hypothetical protein